MPTWIDVAPERDFPPGTRRVVETESGAIAVFNLGGEYRAVADLCTHDGGTLSEGEVEDSQIVCPRHGARFSLRTGEVLAPPAYEGIAVFPVRVENGVVQVGMAAQ